MFSQKSLLSVLVTLVILFIAAKVGNNVGIIIAAVAVIAISAFYVFHVVAKRGKTEEED